MAAIRRGKKSYFLRKKSKRPRGPKKNATRQRKLLASQKKNVCVIRFPKSSYLRTCPLVAWYFNRRLRNDVLSFRRRKSLGGFFDRGHSRKAPLQAGGRQKKQPPRIRCSCPEFLQAALKEVANKKKAKWVVAPAKRRPRYSDDEIFYKLANASDDGSDAGAGTSDVASCPSTQPGTNGPQAVSS